MNVDQLTTPLSFVKEQLLSKGVFLDCRIDCATCLEQPEVFQLLKDAVQGLITEGFLQFDHNVVKLEADNNEVNVITISVKRKTIRVPVKIPVPIEKSPLLITVPGSVPYVSDKAVP